MSLWIAGWFQTVGLLSKEWVFLSTVKQSGGSWNYSYRQPMCGHHPLHFAHLYRSKSRAKVTDAANNEGELSVENILVSLYQDMRKEKR